MEPDRDHVDRLLAQWELERPDLDTAPLAISARVVRLERFLARVSEQALADVEVTEGEGNVLAALRRAGPPYALTPTALYRSLLLSSGAMTNRIDRLEQAGYVERQQDPADRRRVLVQLTDAGRALIDRAMTLNVGALGAELDRALQAVEQQALVDLLRQVLQHFEAPD